MITEDYVIFNIAKLLKEKGFDAECDYLYVDGKLVRAQGCACNWNNGETLFTDYKNECSAPTLQMAMKWLREKGFIISPIPDFRFNKLLYTNLIINTNSDPQRLASELYNTYEEACEAAIKYCLENLI